ncbi:MAG: hypothetical protein COV46_01975 [Deltaproteobacteria bacterium CG11_big_fil_rev_8_21_14_0_20_49_13]|nr:MAG: hypothetical protein COV46_01975 [Deltaproteobacteria bacterium CG11_big_fil_rev_8_21_14_0_20_49_13]
MTELKRVLILEENTDHLQLLTSLLECHFSPIDIHTVETVEDCLDFLEQTPYDIIMSGCYIHNACITERLTDIVAGSNGAPIIIISGSGDENIAAQTIKLGASEYIVKTKKSLDKIPQILTKYFKLSQRTKGKKYPQPGTVETTGRLIREIDHLMQKARFLTTDIASRSKPDDQDALDSLFSQISRLRKLIQDQK